VLVGEKDSRPADLLPTLWFVGGADNCSLCPSFITGILSPDKLSLGHDDAKGRPVREVGDPAEHIERFFLFAADEELAGQAVTNRSHIEFGSDTCRFELTLGLQALVEEQEVEIGDVLARVHVFPDALKDRGGLLGLARAHQGKIKPVRNGDDGSLTAGHMPAAPISLLGFFELSPQEMDQPEVIPDVKLVVLNLGSQGQVGHSLIKLADLNVAVAAVAVEKSMILVGSYPSRVDINGLATAPERRQGPAIENYGLRIIR